MRARNHMPQLSAPLASATPATTTRLEPNLATLCLQVIEKPLLGSWLGFPNLWMSVSMRGSRCEVVKGSLIPVKDVRVSKGLGHQCSVWTAVSLRQHAIKPENTPWKNEAIVPH